MLIRCRPWIWPFAERLGLLQQGTLYEIAYHGTQWRARAGTGDFGVLNEIFLHESYGAALKSLRRGATVIDIGANIGAFSVAAARAGASIVWAFEPVAANVASLSENVARNRLEYVIKPVPLAVAARPGKLSFYLRDSDAGGGTLHPEIHKPWHDERGAMAADIQVIEVYCTTLADFFEKENITHCDLLKIDCEGAEFEIVSLLPPEVARRIDAVVFEYHSDGKVDAIVGLLQQLGFWHVTRHPVYQVIFMARS